MSKLAPYRKAIVAAASAFVTALFAAYLDGTISPVEWIGIASAVLAVTAGVYAVPNAPLPEKPPTT